MLNRLKLKYNSKSGILLENPHIYVQQAIAGYGTSSQIRHILRGGWNELVNGNNVRECYSSSNKQKIKI